MSSKGNISVVEKYNGFELVLSTIDNMMQAYLTIKSYNANTCVTIDEILNFLEKNKITYGVNEPLLNVIVANKMYNSPINIAQGLKPVKGEDGFIKYFFNTNKQLKALTCENGKVDFKELGYVENIEKNAILAEKVPPKKGTNGINVLGEVVEAPLGKDVAFKLGKNVKLSEDGIHVISMCAGRIDFKDGRIGINTVLTIPGNIDASTGNIRFNGDIVINGDIKTGFIVEADGNIEVNGVIEGAIIKAKGNLIVKGGIQGNDKANIYSEGNIICKYIENAKIICEGDITTDFIIHGIIICGNDLNVIGKKGLIVGGQVRVKNQIIANTIGSPMETATYIEVGINPKLKLKRDSYNEEKLIIEKNLKNILYTINSLKDMMKKAALSQEKKQLLTKSIDAYKELTQKLELINKEIKLLEEEIINLKCGKIIVKNEIYPGCKIVIGRNTKYINERTSTVQICIEEGQIVTRS
ncbi:DUF342 domain-containing protein [Alkalithermobacter paradoxus]|uniref:Flagellar Assembly Protein A N-terminal region domain-containing protein n=1 Tax=Alkalithermobacter paradoxus TaxID=29349 RepID=A0A1V4IB09_9FIRM|nr:hypothetical protein CLOTH_03990 [[Clostridium] thermoalcaliphilum]